MGVESLSTSQSHSSSHDPFLKQFLTNFLLLFINKVTDLKYHIYLCSFIKLSF